MKITESEKKVIITVFIIVVSTLFFILTALSGCVNTTINVERGEGSLQTKDSKEQLIRTDIDLTAKKKTNKYNVAAKK